MLVVKIQEFPIHVSTLWDFCINNSPFTGSTKHFALGGIRDTKNTHRKQNKQTHTKRIARCLWKRTHRNTPESESLIRKVLFLFFSLDSSHGMLLLLNLFLTTSFSHHTDSTKVKRDFQPANSLGRMVEGDRLNPHLGLNTEIWQEKVQTHTHRFDTLVNNHTEDNSRLWLSVSLRFFYFEPSGCVKFNRDAVKWTSYVILWKDANTGDGMMMNGMNEWQVVVVVLWTKPEISKHGKRNPQWTALYCPGSRFDPNWCASQDCKQINNTLPQSSPEPVPGWDSRIWQFASFARAHFKHRGWPDDSPPGHQHTLTTIQTPAVESLPQYCV